MSLLFWHICHICLLYTQKFASMFQLELFGIQIKNVNRSDFKIVGQLLASLYCV